MIDYDNMREIIATGLNAYVECPVIKSNQNSPLPQYPFISYTVTTVLSENKGTYGEYDDGAARKAATQTWSISALSDDNVESVVMANKAREWFEYVGTTYLNDNNLIIEKVGGITNRDNVLSVEYEYKNGFDVVFWLFDEININHNNTGWIETAEINEIEIHGESFEAMLERLQNRLDGEQ